MRNYLIHINKIIFMMLFIATHSVADGLPDELLNAPIHLISGETVSLAEYKGEKPVYLKFWATWCQPCRQQMPHFEHVQEKYGDEIEVIGINLGLNDDLRAVQDTIAEFGLTMPMAIDEGGDLAQKFRLIGTPYHLLFDKQMNLIHLGHEADSSLDNKIDLVSRSLSEKDKIIDSSVLNEDEPDISINTNDGDVHALFFTATWCDWYLKETRPVSAERCAAAQNTINSVFKETADISWLGVINRLWTGDEDMAEYRRKYSIAHSMQIDKSNRLFHKYAVHDLPTLLIIKDDAVVARITDFSDENRIVSELKRHKK